MRLPHIIGPGIAVLWLSGCATNHNQAQRAAEQAEAEARAAQEDAREAREETAKAQRHLEETRQAQAAADQDARWARQRAAQAEWQAALERNGQPRTGATEAQAVGPARYRVLFPPDSAELTADAKAKLDVAIPTLKGVPRSGHVVVEGFTDATGDEAHNRALSQQRAEAVADYLKDKGVAGDRITIQALGPREAAPREPTAEARALDRRVDIEIQ